MKKMLERALEDAYRNGYRAGQGDQKNGTNTTGEEMAAVIAKILNVRLEL